MLQIIFVMVLVQRKREVLTMQTEKTKYSWEEDLLFYKPLETSFRSYQRVIVLSPNPLKLPFSQRTLLLLLRCLLFRGGFLMHRSQ